ncbi:restriction endonuclease subunit S [Aeromonas caviae]
MSEVVTTSQQGLAGKYKPYPEYKDSGVEWLGDIPTHWSTTVLKRLCCLTTGLTPPTSDEANYAEDGYPWVRPEDINESGSETNASKFVSNDGWQLLRKIEPNSTLICCIGTIGKCGYVRKTVSTNQQITAATFSKSERYNYYLLQAARTQLEELATGNVLKILNTERLGALNLVKVPVEEADTIAAFLDYETARIDRLIVQQQRLIELLKEKRQAVISHAVTKGLNPHAPMKDSGVEWLGQVPEHWVVSPLKYKCVFSGGGTPSKDNLEYWNGSIPWVSPKDMKSFWITDAEDKITEQAIKESSTKLVQPGAVLMVVRSGILQRTIPVGINTIPVTMNQDMKAIRFSSAVYAEWLSFFIKGYEDSLLLDWRKQGATVESIEHEYLANSLILFPPEEEARSIIAALGRRLDKFDQLEQRASDAITLLQERRSALISAAVTGKIDLRGWTPPAEEVAA